MGVGWHRQNGSFDDLFGSIGWSGFERIFLQFLEELMPMKRLFGLSWRAHNRGSVEIFLGMCKTVRGDFFLHLYILGIELLKSLLTSAILGKGSLDS